MDGDGLSGLHATTSYRARGDRHGLDQRALHRREAGRQTMRHAATHDRVFGESAARAVVAVERDQRAVVVATRAAGETMTTGLERFDGHEIADREILDTVPEL